MKNPKELIQRDALSDMAGAAFDNFEDFEGENYDPNADNFGKINAPGTRVIGNRSSGKHPQKSATFNIFINGSANVAAHVVELFNNEFSITKFANGNTNPGLLPLQAVHHDDFRNSAGTGVAQYFGHGAILSNAGVGVNDGVYFNAAGDLIYNYNVANSDNVSVSCQEVPYRSLFEYTQSGALFIRKMRLQYNIAGQIQNDFTLVYRNILGTKRESSLSPKQFFTPTQFQPLLIDCPTPFKITKERGLQFSLLPASTLSITFFVERMTEPNI